MGGFDTAVYFCLLNLFLCFEFTLFVNLVSGSDDRDLRGDNKFCIAHGGAGWESECDQM